jgi:hypothetical protein
MPLGRLATGVRGQSRRLLLFKHTTPPKGPNHLIIDLPEHPLNAIHSTATAFLQMPQMSTALSLNDSLAKIQHQAMHILARVNLEIREMLHARGN